TEFNAGTHGLPAGLSVNESSITAGPDGDVWFLDKSSSGAVARVAPDGTTVEFGTSAGLRGSLGSIRGIAAGPDGTVWFTTHNASEEQKITVTGSPTGGSFKLIYGGVSTAAIPYNATGTEVETALLELPGLFGGGLSIGGSGPYTVVFGGQLASLSIPL